jgi:hypothetical protein
MVRLGGERIVTMSPTPTPCITYVSSMPHFRIFGTRLWLTLEISFGRIQFPSCGKRYFHHSVSFVSAARFHCAGCRTSAGPSVLSFTMT